MSKAIPPLPPRPETRAERGARQLQELYKKLDHFDSGNLYIAWYGQLRAEEYSHTEALEKTIEHWGLRKKDWWKKRGLD